MGPHISASSIYGTPQTAPVSSFLNPSPGIATAAGPAPESVASYFSPDHPLFVFGVLLAAAAGLIGIAGSARVGPAHASAALGKA